MNMNIKILYDNEAKKDLKSDWGFSALIDAGEKILFDTGDKGDILRKNIEKMDVDLSKVRKVVLSHEHHDHTGGLLSLIDKSMKVYVLRSFSTKFKEKVKKRGDVVEVSKKRKISDNVLTIGEFGKNIKEQSLMIEGENGYILLTGCAHPGLTSIIEKAADHGEIKAVVGGFHGFDDFAALEDIPLLVPCHCTEYKDEIKERYPDKAIDCFAGLEIEV